MPKIVNMDGTDFHVDEALVCQSPAKIHEKARLKEAVDEFLSTVNDPSCTSFLSIVITKNEHRAINMCRPEDFADIILVAEGVKLMYLKALQSGE